MMPDPPERGDRPAALGATGLRQKWRTMLGGLEPSQSTDRVVSWLRSTSSWSPEVEVSPRFLALFFGNLAI